MKMLYTILLILFLDTHVSGQNLVPNAGFEDFFSCPKTINTTKGNTKIAPHWNSPSYGTPDLYNICNTSNMGVQNVTGSSTPFAGNGFAGIIVWEGKHGYREYLQVKLLDTLKKDKIYTVSYRYKLSSYSIYSADRIGFSFVDSSVFYRQDFVLPLFPAYCKIKPKPLDPYTGSWELLELDYLAKGGERFLTLGNFHDNIHTKTTHLSFKTVHEPMLANAAYYYMDEVSVVEKMMATDSSTKKSKEPMLNNEIINFSDSYILDNVLFEYNSDKLLASSFDNLNEIIKILYQQSNWKIKIAGHTDNVGSDQYNLELSERRAFAVKDYLVSQGILESRIQYKGYGKSKPISTESGGNQKRNRRVEIQFY